MDKEFVKRLYQTHQQAARIPSPSMVCNWLDEILGVLFPEFSNHHFVSEAAFVRHISILRKQLLEILDLLDDDMHEHHADLEEAFNERLPDIRDMLMADAGAILRGDPAAMSLTEVIRSYPGFHAIAVYRIAHLFYELGVPLIPRILTEDAHSRTGVDIHPAAVIGRNFCMDHGTGIVIGETVEIGDDVKLYQGVTLGALSVRKGMAKTKRHPTIQDRVIIYANATILGGDTVIGHDSIIGGSVWLTQSVPPQSRVYYQGFVRQRVEEEEKVVSGQVQKD